MNQMEWLYKLANIKYLSKKQFEVLKNNKYIKSYKYLGSWINCAAYIFYVTKEGFDKGFLDFSFCVDVIKDNYICKCGGYYDTDDCSDSDCYERYPEAYEEGFILLRCEKCKSEILRKVEDGQHIEYEL